MEESGRGGGSRRSSQTSGLIIGDFSDDRRHQDFQTESMSMDWTDEKHSLYLNSMEASFVNQLHNSMDLLGWPLQREITDPKLSSQRHRKPCAPSGEFKVLQCGCWQKVNFQRPESELNRTNESRAFLKSPWIQRIRSVRKPQVVASLATLQETVTSQSQAVDLSEVSDQNFVDEDIESEKAGCSKRMKNSDNQCFK